MRRIVIALCTTVTGLVLLLSWPTSLNRSSSGAALGVANAGGAPSTTSAGTSGAAGTSTATTTTYDGAAASTRYGNVQVRITVTDGAVTAAEAIDYPNGNGHDQQINAYAIPILNQEAVAGQSANIDMVSGATYTSGGYLHSLQSALDQAGL